MTPKRLTKKKLEIFLEQLPRMEKTDAAREQYMTPAAIAADMVFLAYADGNVVGMDIIDLGCGTGILGIGAALGGAANVLAVDCEARFLGQGREFAREKGLDVSFLCADVETLCLTPKTQEMVSIQNPPFGAQFAGRGMDQVFLKKAFSLSAAVYSLHKLETGEFLKKLGAVHGFETELLNSYAFPLPHQFHFHRKEKAFTSVGLFRFLRKA